jgi:hypothetical protein
VDLKQIYGRLLVIPNIYPTFVEIILLMEKMTTGQYGKLIGKTRQDIHYKMKKGDKLPGVTRKEYVAGRWIFTVDKNKLKIIA